MARTEPKYPDVSVKLLGEDGNAFMIAARVRAAIRKAHGAEASEEYTREAMHGDYNHFLQTTMRYVKVH